MMDKDLKELKSILRSLLVSSPTEVDMRSLMRDYRTMMGEPFPLSRFGYRDTLTFLKEKCGDCFLIQDSGYNPVLTLIVPDTVKHIDQFVQRQKSSATTKFKGKRRSVAESVLKDNLIVKTFKPPDKPDDTVKQIEIINNKINKSEYNTTKDIDHNYKENHIKNSVDTFNYNRKDSNGNNGVCSNTALQNFMKKRMPLLTESGSQYGDSEKSCDKVSSKGDTDSGHPSSTTSSIKKAKLEELKAEIREVISSVPEGVWCTELMRLYREKYGRELNFSRFGFTSVQSLAYAVEGIAVCEAEHTSEALLRAERPHPAHPAHPPQHTHPPHPSQPPQPATKRSGATHAPASHVSSRTLDTEDALPGIDFDEDVFPSDCMHFVNSVPSQDISSIAPGAMLEVVVGEVYSPTHFWFLRLGPHHYTAMEIMMDDMNQYYNGEGKERVLAAGAVRVGHYCACCYLGDWHRAVIVKILDSDTVKVRHIDYATVETVEARRLKPLLRRWARLPAQALRGRLAAVRPPAAGRRWPWAASAHFLQLVRERSLVANVVARDHQEGILEVLLIDTSTEDDVCIGTEMTRAGHADPRPDSALGTSECYLFPRFDALENGDTPNYAEIHCYLRDGISLDFVEDYRRHVPPCLPPVAAPSPSPSPSPPPPPAPPSPPPSPTAAPAARSGTRSLGQLAERPAPSRGQRAASLGPVDDSDPSWKKSVGVANRIPLLRPEVCPAPESRPRPRKTSHPPEHNPNPPPPPYCPPGPFYPPMYPSGVPPSSSMPAFFPFGPPGPGFSPFGPPGPGFGPMSPHGQFVPPPHMMPPAPMVPPNHMMPPAHSGMGLGPNVHSHPSQGASPAPASFVPGTPRLPNSAVSVSTSDCEVFALLSRVNPELAQRFMMEALNRAMAAASLTGAAPGKVGAATPNVPGVPTAAPGSAGAAGAGPATSDTKAEPAMAMRPPPGFERFVPQQAQAVQQPPASQPQPPPTSTVN